MSASSWRQLVCAGGVLAGLVVLSARAEEQVPPLGKEGENLQVPLMGREDENLELPEGWEFCNQQDPSILRDSQSPRKFRAPRLPAESGRNAYLVYIRAKKTAGECQSLPVRFIGKSGPVLASNENLAPGAGQPAQSPAQLLQRVSQIRDLPMQKLLERVVEVSSSEEELSPVRFLVPAERTQRRKAVLPSSYAACKASDGAVAVDPKKPHELALNANVERGRTVEVLGTRDTVAEAVCPMTSDNKLDEGKLKRFRVQFIPPVLQTKGLRPGDILLDWSKSEPTHLSIYVKASVVTNEVLREETRLVIPGLQAQGVPTGPCDSDNLCEYRIDAIHNWKSDARPLIRTTSSTLQRAFEEGEVWDFDGSAIQDTAFDPIEVHHWRVPPLQQIVLQVDDEQLENRENDPLKPIVKPIEDPLAWLMAPGSVKCTQLSDTSICAWVEHPPDASPRASLRLDVDEKLRAYLKGNKDLDLKIPLRQNIQLVDKNTLDEISQKEFAVKIRKRKCEYRIQQLTKAFAGLSDGWVYYGVQPIDKRTCPTSPSWTVKTDNTAVRLGSSVETLGENLVRIHFDVLPETPPNPAVTVQFMETDAIKVESGNSAVTLTISPRLVFKPKKIVTSLHDEFGLEGAGPPEGVPTLEGQVIGMERANWLFLEAPFIKNWSLELVSSNVHPCHVAEISERRSSPLLPFREQTVCLVGAKEGTEDLVLQAELLGLPSDFLLDGVVAPKDLKEHETQQGSARHPLLGSMTLRWPVKTGYLRLAYPLAELAQLKCGRVDVSSDTSYRAVDFGNEDTRRCKLNFWLPLDDKAKAMLESLGGAPSDEKKQKLYDYVLEVYGRQRFKVELATADATKKEFTTANSVRPSSIELHARDNFKNYRDRRLEVDDLRLGVSVDFDFLQAGTLSIPNYGLVQLKVSHENTSDYVSDDPRSKKDPFTVHVSRMPDSTFPGWAQTFGWEKRPGWGIRGNATFTVPAKLFRTRHNGYNAKTSSQFAKLQSAEFAAGMLYSVEFWDFDNIEPVLDFANPQLQAGFLLNTNLNTLELPRLSLVVGLGLRLPGGTAPTSVVESKPGLIVWYELSKGKVQKREHSLLFGIQLNFVTIGN